MQCGHAEEDHATVLVVRNSSEVKAVRSALEESGYYDKSRRIQRVSFPIPDDPLREGFAVPITPSCATHLKSSSPHPPPYTDCVLANIELPPSKRTKAKLHRPYEALREAVRRYLVEAEYSVEDVETLLLDVPRSWERHGDLAVLPESSFKDPRWLPHFDRSKNERHTRTSREKFACKEIAPNEASVQEDGGQQQVFLELVASALNCKRLAIDRSIVCDSYRSSGATLLLGDNGWVDHQDNRVHYLFDVTKCMFSSGNISEKLRVANFNCEGETVVDLYAGIGYFTLPYLVHSRAALVHACEWNPSAVEALERGLVANKVKHKCVVHQGDNRKVAPVGVADRVNLGLVPSSEEGWPVACRALENSTGGWMHVHGNVSSKHDEGTLSTEHPHDRSCREYNPWETKEREKSSSSEGTTSVRKDSDEQMHSARRESSTEIERCQLPQSDKMGTLETNLPLVSKRGNWERWAEYVSGEMLKLLKRENPRRADANGGDWIVAVRHIEHVKSYAPHIDHLVVDLECRPATPD